MAGDRVPLSAVKDIAEVVGDPQIAARDMIVDVDYPASGGLAWSVSPLKLSETPATPRGLAPQFGAAHARRTAPHVRPGRPTSWRTCGAGGTI